MDVIAERALLFGARGRREPGFLAMQRDQRMGILDRGAIGKKGCWQVHHVPGPLLGISAYAAGPHRPVPNRNERVGKVNRKAPPDNPSPPLAPL